MAKHEMRGSCRIIRALDLSTHQLAHCSQSLAFSSFKLIPGLPAELMHPEQ